MWKDYFDFSKSQRLAIYFMLLIIALIYSYSWYRIRNYEFPHEEHLAKREALVKFIREREALLALEKEKKIKQFANQKEPKIQLFPFNPNLISKTEWEQLGLKEYQIRNIQNYLKSGGKFNSADDLDKIYALKQMDLSELKKYVVIPGQEDIREWENEETSEALADSILLAEHESNSDFNRETVVLPELNSINAEELQVIRGIGPIWSKRIIAYRDLLGGFYSFDQLHEVYGLDSLVIESIRQKISIEPSNIQKLDLNFEKRNQLNRHPYIDEHSLEKILSYRARVGFIEHPEKLLIDSILSDSAYKRIINYLQ